MEYGECFALLGISGAGKSTTFKCLTGELEADQGQLFVNGYNIGIPMEYSQARKHIGYCPQFDAIFEGLTVREHLDIYARLKCIGDDVRPRLVE
jgi:ABC-type multidrug transport system ATPase subunit